MNKSLYFVIGTILGAAGGSIGTYFLVKGRFKAESDKAIEEYAEHAESRIEAIRERYEDTLTEDMDEEESEPENNDEDADERKINNNEGVKKYHHYDGQELPEYAAKRVFKKVVTKEEEMAKKENSEIVELSEQEYLDFAGEKQTIDALFRYEGDKVEELWGYQTDNQTTCQARFGKGFIDLVGIDGEDMLDWFEPDEGVVVKYFLNKEMATAFEVVVHCDPDTYYNREES